jgi:hypothetical protein
MRWRCRKCLMGGDVPHNCRKKDCPQNITTVIWDEIRSEKLMRRPKLPLRMWGGFIEGKLDFRQMDDEWGGENYRWVPALFVTQKEARQQYESVREVWVRVTQWTPGK